MRTKLKYKHSPLEILDLKRVWICIVVLPGKSQKYSFGSVMPNLLIENQAFTKYQGTMIYCSL